MFCTGTKWCDFFLRTTVGMYCERITFDERMCYFILPKLGEFFSVLPYLNLLFHVTLRFTNLRSVYKTKKHGYIKYAWSRILLCIHYIIFFGAIYITLLCYKLYLFTSTLCFQSEPQGITKQEIAQFFFIHVFLIYSRKGYPVTLTKCMGSISHHIMLLVINSLGGGHTHTHKHVHIQMSTKK